MRPAFLTDQDEEELDEEGSDLLSPVMGGGVGGKDAVISVQLHQSSGVSETSAAPAPDSSMAVLDQAFSATADGAAQPEARAGGQHPLPRAGGQRAAHADIRVRAPRQGLEAPRQEAGGQLSPGEWTRTKASMVTAC